MGVSCQLRAQATLLPGISSYVESPIRRHAQDHASRTQ